MYMDNFYNRYSLTSYLLAQQTYTIGSLRIDRKNIPAEVKKMF